MKVTVNILVLGSWLACIGATCAGEQQTVKCTKDTFGRSNERNQNSGGSEVLYVAHNSMLRALFAFDLSGVTNQVVGAELVLQPADSNEKPLSMVVSPMTYTKSNAAWREGSGARGTTGRNAISGEATFSRCSFPDGPWETAAGKSERGLDDPALWLLPISRINRQSWVQGAEIRLKLESVSFLEACRKSGRNLVTFGLWGVGGGGYYGIASKESGNGPSLVLTLNK